MKLRLLSNLLALLVTVSAYAASPDKTSGLTGRYDEDACLAVTQPASACNQGAEAFSKFIAQFNSSLKFRALRMKCDDRLQDFLLTPWWKTGRIYKFVAERPAKSNDYTLMTWTNVESDSVWMTVAQILPGEEGAGGISAAYHFRRMAGKWYLVDGFVKEHAA